MSLGRTGCRLLPPALRLAALALAALAAAGCADNTRLLNQARTELRQAREENATLKQDLQSARQLVSEQQGQIDTLRGLGEKRLSELFHVTAVKLGRYSAGLDTAGKGYDDGVRVYLRPVDQYGDALKAAGSVKIQLFDLAAPAEDNLLGECDFPVQQVAKHWSAGFMTYHYRFDCPWKTPPKHADVTVRATFTDYLTGQSFSDQKVVTVKLPPKPQ